LLFVSCKKDKDAQTPYSKTISGVRLTDINASPVGSVGNPDINATSDSFSMEIYPTPSSSTLMVYAAIANAVPLTVTAKLVYVSYPSGPKTYTLYNGNTIQVPIENANLAGTVAATLSQSIGLPSIDTTSGGIHGVGNGSITAPSQPVSFQFDVSALPQGFYRVYIETSDGKQFWDNGWVLRP
jgi:hypothetical protein